MHNLQEFAEPIGQCVAKREKAIYVN